MKKLVVCCTLLLLLACRAGAEETPKLKGLWCTGGCCHDYKKHAPLLTEKIAELANVEFKIVFGLEQFQNKDYAKGYDLVVYDLCYADEKGKELIGNVTGTIAAGKPAVIIHCSLHNFRSAEFDDWREAMGMTSKSHDRFRELKTKKVAGHPTTDFWPADWSTPGDELYQTIKLWPSATALMTVYSPDSKKDHVVTWVNRYGKGRVFATTLGHNLLTVGQEEYHQLLANGVLWVCGKLDEQGKPAAGYEGTGRE
ncbi:MAG: ThuA domain-containing protein [Pirellulales bacterium]|nr:ThuA domain-containing protein [Pirellulales bacterium]